jgi:hypothetical protein
MSEHVTRNVAIELGQYPGEEKSSGGDRLLGLGCKSPPTVRIRNRSNALKAHKGLCVRLRGLKVTSATHRGYLFRCGVRGERP